MMASRLAPSGTDRNDSTGHPSENARSAAEAEASNDADAGADDAARDASSMLKASGPLTAPARVTRRTAKGETDRDASSSMTSGAGTVGAEVLQLRLLHDLARRGTALTPAQAERAAALIRIVAERNPGGVPLPSAPRRMFRRLSPACAFHRRRLYDGLDVSSRRRVPRFVPPRSLP